MDVEDDRVRPAAGAPVRSHPEVQVVGVERLPAREGGPTWVVIVVVAAAVATVTVTVSVTTAVVTVTAPVTGHPGRGHRRPVGPTGG